jgi:hypothetical protein
MFGPALGAKPLPLIKIMKFTILEEVFMLYITMHSGIPPHVRL